MKLKLGKFELQIGKKAASKKKSYMNLPYSQNYYNLGLNPQAVVNITREGYEACSAISACIGAWQYTFPEPEKKVYSKTTHKELPNHKIKLLLRNPNPFESESDMAARVITYLKTGGNCYVYLARSGNGRGTIQELWAYGDDHITPITNGGAFIDHYLYRGINGTQQKKIAIEDIIHLKLPSPNPEAPWMGMSELMLLAREIDTDVAITRFIGGYMKNYGMPGFGVILDESEDSIDDDDLTKMRADFAEDFGSDSAGGAFIAHGVKDYKPLTPPLKDIHADGMRFSLESRICAVLGVPPSIAGMQIGADATYANYDTDLRIFTQQRLVPIWKMVESALTHRLCELIDPSVEIRHDLSEVEILRQSKIVQQRGIAPAIFDAQVAFRSGQILRDDAVQAAKLLLGITEEDAALLFREAQPSEIKPPISESAVNPNGEVVNPKEKVAQ